MQIRKQEVEDALLAHAEIEFFKHGFERASIRRILLAAGVSIGNFYNYFGSKEALYEALVGPEYHRFLRLVSEHNQKSEVNFNLELLESKAFLQSLPDRINEWIPDFSIRFVILLEGSQGTKYEGARSSLMELAKSHLSEHISEFGTTLSKGLPMLLAEQFITGIIQIIKNHKDDKQARNVEIADYLLFFIMGIMGLIQAK